MKNLRTTYTLISIYLIGAIAFLSAIFLFESVSSETVTSPKPMNVSISTTIALTVSDNLTAGIFYTNITGSENNVQYPVDADNTHNATWNYLGGTGGTQYYINNNGTTGEDICGEAVTVLTCSPSTPQCGSETIGLGNATWSNNTQATTPAYPAPNIWTTDSTNANSTAKNLAKSGTIYTRYWLYVPNYVSTGTYNTTFKYCAVVSGSSCDCP